MADQTASLGVLVFGRDKSASKTLNSLKKSAKRVAGALGTALKAGALASAIALAAATKAAIDFEKSMSEIKTLRFPHADVQEMRTLVQGLAVQFGDLDAQAAAAYQAISAGAEDLGSVLVQANVVAVAGVTDTATAIDGLTNVMNAWKESGLTAQEAANAFFVTIKLGKTNAEELSKFIGNAASTLAAFGVTFNESMAAIAAGSATMGNARKVITGLRQAVLNIKAPTKAAQEEAARLGIEFNTGALRAKGFKGLLDDITSSANFNKDSLGKLFNSAEGLGTVLALTANKGQAFSKALKAMESDTTAAQEAFETMSKTTSFQMQRLGGMFSVLATEVGKFVKGSGAFKGILEGVSTSVATAIVFFTQLSASASTTTSAYRDLAIKGIGQFSQILGASIAIVGSWVVAFGNIPIAIRAAQIGINKFVLFLQEIPLGVRNIFDPVEKGFTRTTVEIAKTKNELAALEAEQRGAIKSARAQEELVTDLAGALGGLGDAIEAAAKNPQAALAELDRQTEAVMQRIRDRITDLSKPPAAPPEDPTGIGSAMVKAAEVTDETAAFIESRKRLMFERLTQDQPIRLDPIVVDIERASDATNDWLPVLSRVQDTIATGIAGAITTALFRAKNLGDALVRVGEQIASTILQLTLAKSLTLAFGGGLTGFLFGASGGFAGRLPRSPKKFQGGGFAGRDDVPALLNREELVLSSGVVKAIQNRRNPQQSDVIAGRESGGGGDVHFHQHTETPILPLAAQQERQLDEVVRSWMQRRQRLGVFS